MSNSDQLDTELKDFLQDKFKDFEAENDSMIDPDQILAKIVMDDQAVAKRRSRRIVFFIAGMVLTSFLMLLLYKEKTPEPTVKSIVYKKDSVVSGTENRNTIGSFNANTVEPTIKQALPKNDAEPEKTGMENTQNEHEETLTVLKDSVRVVETMALDTVQKRVETTLQFKDFVKQKALAKKDSLALFVK